jgi:hypothetical protein
MTPKLRLRAGWWLLSHGLFVVFIFFWAVHIGFLVPTMIRTLPPLGLLSIQSPASSPTCPIGCIFGTSRRNPNPTESNVDHTIPVASFIVSGAGIHSPHRTPEYELPVTFTSHPASLNTSDICKAKTVDSGSPATKWIEALPPSARSDFRRVARASTEIVRHANFSLSCSWAKRAVSASLFNLAAFSKDSALNRSKSSAATLAAAVLSRVKWSPERSRVRADFSYGA